jgi:hypothetical protein
LIRWLQLGHRKKNAGQKALKMQQGAMRNKQIPMTMSIEIGNESGGRQKIMAIRGGTPAKKNPKPNPRTIRRVVRGSMRVGRPMKELPLLLDFMQPKV